VGSGKWEVGSGKWEVSSFRFQVSGFRFQVLEFFINIEFGFEVLGVTLPEKVGSGYTLYLVGLTPAHKDVAPIPHAHNKIPTQL
jgi:hypothetical protein